MSFIVVRVRSDVKFERTIRETMGMLNLTRVNHATIIPDNPQYRGMLQKAKDYVTWGVADVVTIHSMLTERGRLPGDAPLTDEVVSGTSDHADIQAFAVALAEDRASLKDVKGLKPVFRLHPPRGSKGWGGIKKAASVGGALGRRDDIEHLVSRMI